MIIAIFLAILTAIPFWEHPEYSVYLDLIGQARLHVTGLAILFLLWALIWRRWYRAALLACIIGFNGYWIGSTLVSAPIHPNARVKTSLRIMHFNMYGRKNPSPEQAIDLIRLKQPDIIWLLETYHPNNNFIKKLKKATSKSHPFFYLQKKVGRTLISKHPFIQKPNIVNIEGSTQTVLHTAIKVQNQRIHVIGLHALSPRDPYRLTIRDKLLRGVGEYIATTIPSTHPVIVLGDMNSATWRPSTREMMEVAGLYNTDSLTNITLTWPSNIPFPIRVPIDHILHSYHFCSSGKKKTTTAYGSDHFPVYADLKLCH